MNTASEKVYIVPLVLYSIISIIHNEYYPKNHATAWNRSIFAQTYIF